ncbi:hypothetical protein Btru_065153 [Bulinus truncatus]|nr:hypothetical protein Btru_065153 [Bulinus truncatus]
MRVECNKQTRSPGKDDNPSPGKDDNPSPGKDDNPSPGKDENPSPGTDEYPSPGKDDNPSPAFNAACPPVRNLPLSAFRPNCGPGVTSCVLTVWPLRVSKCGITERFNNLTSWCDVGRTNVPMPSGCAYNHTVNTYPGENSTKGIKKYAQLVVRLSL